jgi:hypothetical protein
MMRTYHPLLDTARSAVLDGLSGHAEALEQARRKLTHTWGHKLAEAAFVFAFAALEHEEAEAEERAHQEALDRCRWRLGPDRGPALWCEIGEPLSLGAIAP